MKSSNIQSKDDDQKSSIENLKKDLLNSSKRPSQGIQKLKRNDFSNNILNNMDNENKNKENSSKLGYKAFVSRRSMPLLTKPKFNSGIIVPGRKSVLLKKRKKGKKKKKKDNEEENNEKSLDEQENNSQANELQSIPSVSYKESLKDVNSLLIDKLKGNNSLDNLYKRPSFPSNVNLQGGKEMESESPTARRKRLEREDMKKSDIYFNVRNRLYEKIHFYDYDRNESTIKLTHRLNHNYSTDDCCQIVKDPNEVNIKLQNLSHFSSKIIQTNLNKNKYNKNHNNQYKITDKDVFIKELLRNGERKYHTFYQRAKALEKKEKLKLERMIMDNNRKNKFKDIWNNDKKKNNTNNTNIINNIQNGNNKNSIINNTDNINSNINNNKKESDNNSMDNNKNDKKIFLRTPFISVTYDKSDINNRYKLSKFPNKNKKYIFSFRNNLKKSSKNINKFPYNENEKECECMGRLIENNKRNNDDGSGKAENDIKLRLFIGDNFEENKLLKNQEKRIMNMFLTSPHTLANTKNSSNNMYNYPFRSGLSRNKNDNEDDLSRRIRNAKIYHDLFRTETQKMEFRREEKGIKGNKHDLSLDPTFPSSSVQLSSQNRPNLYNSYDMHSNTYIPNNPQKSYNSNIPVNLKNSYSSLDTISFDLMLNNINDKLKVFNTIKTIRNNLSKSVGMDEEDRNKDELNKDKLKSNSKNSQDSEQIFASLYNNLNDESKTKNRKHKKIFEEIQDKIQDLNSSSKEKRNVRKCFSLKMMI